jgi:putative ABC transport system ATP-binding protein
MRTFRNSREIAEAAALETRPETPSGAPQRERSARWTLFRRQPVPTEGAAAAILEAHEVTKRYELNKETVEALRGVTMSVAPGEFVALMGPSGSGKSTLLQLLGGLDRPSTGSVVFEGRDISRLSDGQATKLRRDRTGFVFQAFNLIPLLSVRENIALPFTIAGSNPNRGELRDRVNQVIELVELTGKESHRPDQLSTGEQQRVAVARALVTRPSVLLADEPTGNLDYTTGGELLESLWRSAEHTGQTVVLVTHDARAAAYADRVLVIGDGRIRDEIVLGRRSDHSAAPLITRLAQIGL